MRPHHIPALTPEEIKEAMDLWDEGHSMAYLSRALNLSYEVVRRRLTAGGVTTDDRLKRKAKIVEDNRMKRLNTRTKKGSPRALTQKAKEQQDKYVAQSIETQRRLKEEFYARAQR